MGDAAVQLGLLVAELLLRLVVVSAVAMHEHEEEQKQHNDAKERLLMNQLLGEGWERTPGRLEYFKTHTLCQRCNRMFDTTNPKDVCISESRCHTYTPKLHAIIARQVGLHIGRSCPKLFLPGLRQGGAITVKPPPLLEEDWLFCEDDSKASLADAQKSTAQFLPADQVEASVNEPDLREVAVLPDGVAEISEADRRLQVERQRMRAAFSSSKETEFVRQSLSRPVATASSSSSSLSSNDQRQNSVSAFFSNLAKKIVPAPRKVAAAASSSTSSSTASTASTSAPSTSTTSSSSSAAISPSFDPFVAPQPSAPPELAYPADIRLNATVDDDALADLPHPPLDEPMPLIPSMPFVPIHPPEDDQPPPPYAKIANE